MCALLRYYDLDDAFAAPLKAAYGPRCIERPFVVAPAMNTFMRAPTPRRTSSATPPPPTEGREPPPEALQTSSPSGPAGGTSESPRSTWRSSRGGACTSSRRSARPSRAVRSARYSLPSPVEPPPCASPPAHALLPPQGDTGMGAMASVEDIVQTTLRLLEEHVAEEERARREGKPIFTP